MREVKVSKAEPVTSDTTVEGVVIHVIEPIPRHLESILDLDGWESWYKLQAAMVADALTSTLPQGTLHQLIVLLLERYPSLYSGAPMP